MNAGDGLARHAGGTVFAIPHAAAEGVIEDHRALAAGRFQHRAFGFGVADALQFIFVVEILLFGGAVDQRETFPVQRQILRDRAHVVDFDRMGLGDDVADGHAGLRVGVGVRLFRHVREVNDRAVHFGERGEVLELQGH